MSETPKGSQSFPKRQVVRKVSEDDMQMTNNHMKECYSSLGRKMQIKPTLEILLPTPISKDDKSQRCYMLEELSEDKDAW